jgi:hypothetical protein
VEKAESVFDVEIGTDIDSFIERISTMPAIIYFHNLKFDGHFLMDWLLRGGYRHTQDQYPRKGEFTTLIDAMGKFYTITVAWETGKRTEFRDSWKKLPMSVARVAKSFKQPEVKGDIDYHLDRPVGYIPTREERNYIARDVLIIARALKTQFSQGMRRLTVGSDALFEYKTILGKRIFDKLFPVLPLTMDAEIRSAYRGGYTYADERFRGELTGSGRVYDVNSLYPSVMYNRILPYKEPIFFPGMPKPTERHPLYIVSITFTAKLKPDHIPCIQVKGSSFFLATEYVKEIPTPITLMCSSVDLALWQDHYDLDIHSYNGGWAFEGISGIFCDYIDKWMEIKINNEGGLKEIAKLHLNSLYGKFGTNPNVRSKIPVLEDGIVRLKRGVEETRDPIYAAMAVFIAAYARETTIRAAQENYDVFAYCDTDSLHLLTDDDPIALEVDPNKLGAWKFEYGFESAMYVRAKQYMEQRWPVVPFVERKFESHFAGLPVDITSKMTFEDIVDGRVFHGKKIPKAVPGGIVLEETSFTLNL